MTWQKYSGPYTEDISFNSDDSEQCHCLKILSLSSKLPRHSTVCTNRQKGEMDISSASGPHSLDITFELAESRARAAAECLQLCLFVFTNSAPGCSASSANNFKVGSHNSLSQNFKNQYILIEQILLNVKHVLKFYKWEGESCYPAREFMLILVYFI